MGLDTFDISSSVEVAKDVMTSSAKDFLFHCMREIGDSRKNFIFRYSFLSLLLPQNVLHHSKAKNDDFS